MSLILSSSLISYCFYVNNVKVPHIFVPQTSLLHPHCNILGKHLFANKHTSMILKHKSSLEVITRESTNSNFEFAGDDNFMDDDWKDQEDVDDLDSPWEGAILYQRNPSITHLEYCTTLERLGLGHVSSKVSKSRASLMGLRATKSVKDFPHGTPVLLSIDVTRKKQNLKLDGIIRTVITLGCNRWHKYTNLKLPMIYTMDCVENDCSSLLKSLTKRDFYPSLLLYPAERKEAISYDREISVFNIMKFIADQGGNSHWIYKERDILWSEPELGAWNEKQFEVTSEPLTDEDVLLSKENNEILLKDRTQTQKLEIKSNQIKPNTPRDSSGSGHKTLPGSILAATQKLQNVYPFSRSKILMVKINQSIGFEGVIINKLISWDSITELEEGLESLKEAPISYGGPVITRGMPLVSLTRQSFENEHPEVLPDIYFLDQLATNNLMQNLKLHNRSMTDYWFFVGYSAWGWNQLFDEIADGSWNISNGTVEQFEWPMT